MEEHRDTRMTKARIKKWCRRDRISFSARLPRDVVLGRGVFEDSIICAVKYSTNPFSDIRDSILEMIHCSGGVQDWKQMEELIYCYIVLNPSEVHHVIKDAFLSLLASNLQ
ncbi:OLC1v1020958C1 [Oldenlandia corymbosa var. corymbosa]|uniref:Transcription repressor n=1 Tax=Oldenlandia corymbosa var. corymbosa TaxID=529605 RepID=A0AAV1BV73_OLDCO|nr:OLC1v1020958C1 [Oldenlandia corymbosa var. corymbosa]